jgi:hypothetical protein
VHGVLLLLEDLALIPTLSRAQLVEKGCGYASALRQDRSLYEICQVLQSALQEKLWLLQQQEVLYLVRLF